MNQNHNILSLYSLYFVFILMPHYNNKPQVNQGDSIRFLYFSHVTCNQKTKKKISVYSLIDFSNYVSLVLISKHT